MRRWIAGFAASATLLVASATGSVATEGEAPPPSPIHVTRCDIVPQEVPRRGTAQETIRISFSIDGDVAADEAHFVVASGANHLKGFIARGMFSKGVIIADRLLEASPSVGEFDAASGKIGCFATYVHFVDGASWPPPTTASPAP